MMVFSVMVALMIGQAPTMSGAEARHHVGENVTVCGLVASTRYDDAAADKPTFLNLDKPYPNQSLTVVIPGADRGRFREPEVHYQKARICVTGRVEQARRIPGALRIVVTAPEQIREADKPRTRA